MGEQLTLQEFENQLSSVPKYFGPRGMIFDARSLFADSQASTDVLAEHAEDTLKQYIAEINIEPIAKERSVNLVYLGVAENIESIVKNLREKGKSIFHCHDIQTSQINESFIEMQCYLGSLTLTYSLAGHTIEDIDQYKVNFLRRQS